MVAEAYMTHLASALKMSLGAWDDHVSVKVELAEKWAPFCGLKGRV